MDSLDAIRIFQRVAELGGFTRAAEALGLPKASVSAAVQRLERSIGAQLLHRTTRRVQLTADGQTFYQRSLDLLADVEELQGLFRDGGQLEGRLRVDMSAGLAREYVIPQLPGFLDAHPLLQIELGSSDRLVDVVREGYDCVVRAGDAHDESLVARPLGLMAVASCASPAYLQRRGIPRSVEELEDHRLIHYAGHFGQRPFGFEYAQDGRYLLKPMRGEITVNSGDAYVAAALAGLGIIQVPIIGVKHLLERGALIEILADAPAAAMPLNLLYPQRRHLPRRTRVFMDWLGGVLMPHLQGSHPEAATAGRYPQTPSPK
ncbi:LysR family transcriptional regulator [Lysobacter enzymogenes]|uniref:Transcriptional regulator n=2 Tax=Gammaproteobacteria TaxID=1236 RepID=A0AAU9ALH4_LYSEN|nr:LysR family transcriptional regulator [Lysobacter enzymogenes]BAV96654.1 transcriptional regulator [Lysobacter enzymogenes]